VEEQPLDARGFTSGDRRERAPVSAARAGLHLDGDERGTIANDEVELAVAVAPVPFEHDEPLLLEKGRGKHLSLRAEGLVMGWCAGHVAPPAAQREGCREAARAKTGEC